MRCWRHAPCKKPQGSRRLPRFGSRHEKAKATAKATATARVLWLLFMLFRFATSAPAWVFYKWWMWVWIWMWWYWYYVLWVYSKMRRAFRLGKKRALPSGVFRLRFAPVPPKSRRDFPPAPLTLAGRCRYRIRARAPRDQDVRCAASASRSGRPSRETEAVALSGRSLT